SVRGSFCSRPLCSPFCVIHNPIHMRFIRCDQSTSVVSRKCLLVASILIKLFSKVLSSVLKVGVRFVELFDRASKTHPQSRVVLNLPKPSAPGLFIFLPLLVDCFRIERTLATNHRLEQDGIEGILLRLCIHYFVYLLRRDDD